MKAGMAMAGNEMNPDKITSLDEYIKIITELSKTLKRGRLFEDILLFRGHKSKDYELIPSIAQERGLDPSVQPSVLHEADFIKEAQRKRPDIFTHEEYPVNMLTKLQHFGIPTRLLDITTNALVALYFACQKDKEADGEVIVFCVDKHSKICSCTSPVPNAIALSEYSSYITNFEFDELIRMAENEKFFYTFSQRYGQYKNREEYIDSIRPRFEKHLFLFPLELSERQKRQQGAFIIFPNILQGNIMRNAINPIDKDDKCIKKRITIKREYKTEILKQLSLFGITEDFLFPDNIDIICRTIKTNAKLFYSKSEDD